jgi:hypothetical protein
VSQGFRWGFGKTLSLWFGFDGTTFILARQGGDPYGIFTWASSCGSTSAWRYSGLKRRFVGLS